MKGRSQMQGGKNWILPKKIYANRFFWDSHWLEIWIKPLMSLYWTEWRESVSMDSVNPSDNHNASFWIPWDGDTPPLLRSERPPALRAGTGGAPPQHDKEAGGGLHRLPGQHTDPRHPRPIQKESQVSHSPGSSIGIVTLASMLPHRICMDTEQ